MSLTSNPYMLLGVTPGATPDELKIAFRRAARRLHPDVNQNNPGASAQFQEITDAYELLSDVKRRHEIDQTLAGQNAADRATFSLRVTPSKRAIGTLPEPQVIYLLAEVFPDPGVKERSVQEARLNLTLVLDRSNSMNGSRLERVKAAAHEIIDQLSPDDILAVIVFNDRAETTIPASTLHDKAALKARISMMKASGGTEIFRGLQAGVEQNRRFLAPKLVNHIILLTDGNTFGDHDRSVELAREVAEQGISLSAMGLGQDWNDDFLDELASVTGGICSYVKSPGSVVRFLNNQVRSLANIFAERLQISIAPDPDVSLESAFKISPQAQPVAIDSAYIPLGGLQVQRPTSLLIQFQLHANMQVGFRSVARLAVKGDILGNTPQLYQAVSDISLEISEKPQPEEPPALILDALAKLTLYRMQEQASEALKAGDVEKATRQLENLANRLLTMGMPNLAAKALSEARRVAHTRGFSDTGRKELKYTTRFLLSATAEDVAT